MTKYYCDVCGKELTTLRYYIELPYHFLAESLLDCYTDKDGNPVSGKKEKLDLCASCSNRIYGKAVQELQKIKKEY